MATAALIPTDPDLRQRRDRLFEIHSILRSADNLRPDEAFDELVKLYSLWVTAGHVSFEDACQSEAEVQLSHGAFDRATELLGPLLAQGRRDTGADLFQELADVGVRAGLGQYFTPGPVARAMAAYLAPTDDEAWIDPFCGSGLLLGEVAAAAAGSVRLYGIDRDPRVLRLARLEAAIHHPHAPLTLVNANALTPLTDLRNTLGAPAGGFDGVVTNPPFGAEMHRDEQATYERFTLTSGRSTSLEILGLERSVQLLRPGGRLGIVLPQSIISNRGCRHVRRFLLDQCEVDAVLSLPPETFGPYRGVGKAAVVFATRKPSSRAGRETVLAVARDIGWDATGRRTAPEDVTSTARTLAAGLGATSVAIITDDQALERNMTPEWHLRPREIGVPLKDLAHAIFTGRSPGRAAYIAADSADPSTVYRVLKVGDLTGSGIDWSLGDRSCAAFTRPVMSKLLEINDLALTAAAHHPRYIGAKVDVVDCMPDEFVERVLPCAEVMVIRPKVDRIDPHVLLLWLRSDTGRRALQACVTGQTAHLYPEDVGDIDVPSSVLEASHDAAIELIHQSLQLRRRSETAASQARELFASG